MDPVREKDYLYLAAKQESRKNHHGAESSGHDISSVEPQVYCADADACLKKDLVHHAMTLRIVEYLDWQQWTGVLLVR